jgi:hypothetical protein
VKVTLLCYHADVCFILAARLNSLEGLTSPDVFQDLKIIGQYDLLLSDDESMELVNLQPTLGMPVNMEHFLQLKHLITEYCTGLIVALIKTIIFYQDFLHYASSTEIKCIQEYY